MWISIIGPPSCKRNAAEFLNKFVLIEPEQIENISLLRPQDYIHDDLLRRFRMNLTCQKSMHDNEIINISSFWSCFEVYAKSYADVGIMSEDEFDKLKNLYETISPLIEPPSIFVYLKTSLNDARNRIVLDGKDEIFINEDFTESVCRRYDEFTDKIRTQMVTVETKGRSFDEISADIQFAMDQSKSSKMSDQTFWSRRIF